MGQSRPQILLTASTVTHVARTTQINPMDTSILSSDT